MATAIFVLGQVSVPDVDPVPILGHVRGAGWSSSGIAKQLQPRLEAARDSADPVEIVIDETTRRSVLLPILELMATDDGHPMTDPEKALLEAAQVALGERRKITIDGIEVDIPAEMTDEEALVRHRELHEAREQLDVSSAFQAILADMENADPPWPPEMLEFVRTANDAREIAALHRAFGTPMTDRERLDLIQKMLEERHEEGDATST